MLEFKRVARTDKPPRPLQKCHDEVIVKLLKLFARLLELDDEDQLARQHRYDVQGEDHLRYMHYAARSPEENKRVGEMYTPGHTDLGSITLLFRQPVCGLQILNNEGQWKWVVRQKKDHPRSDQKSSFLASYCVLTFHSFLCRNHRTAPSPSTPAMP